MMENEACPCPAYRALLDFKRSRHASNALTFIVSSPAGEWRPPPSRDPPSHVQRAEQPGARPPLRPPVPQGGQGAATAGDPPSLRRPAQGHPHGGNGRVFFFLDQCQRGRRGVPATAAARLQACHAQDPVSGGRIPLRQRVSGAAAAAPHSRLRSGRLW